MSSCTFESVPTHVPGMLLPRFEYQAPETLAAAGALLAEAKGEAHLLAGGTDLLIRMKRGLLRPRLLVSLRRVTELRGIEARGRVLRLGASTTMSQLAAEGTARLGGPLAALAEGAASVGGPLIRNRATVGGNIVNARPCADTVPPLVVLGATLEVSGPAGSSRRPLDGFIIGPGQTQLAAGEILVAIEVPVPPSGTPAGSCYLKLTRRSAMEITIVGCAAALELGDGGKIARARLVLTSVAPVPLRVPAVEPLLEGRLPGPTLIAEAARTARAACRPIDDQRAPASFRSETVEVLARRALETALRRATERSVQP